MCHVPCHVPEGCATGRFPPGFAARFGLQEVASPRILARRSPPPSTHPQPPRRRRPRPHTQIAPAPMRPALPPGDQTMIGKIATLASDTNTHRSTLQVRAVRCPGGGHTHNPQRPHTRCWRRRRFCAAAARAAWRARRMRVAAARLDALAAHPPTPEHAISRPRPSCAARAAPTPLRPPLRPRRPPPPLGGGPPPRVVCGHPGLLHGYPPLRHRRRAPHGPPGRCAPPPTTTTTTHTAAPRRPGPACRSRAASARSERPLAQGTPEGLGFVVLRRAGGCASAHPRQYA
jgi:hypothetical protein